jgi:hypothetical protein
MLVRRVRTAGSTSQIVVVTVLDSASTSGGRKTGIAYGSVTAYYKRSNGTASVAAVVNTIATLGTFAGDATHAAWKEVDATNMPGVYEVHLPDNMLAAGATEATLSLKATGMEQVDIQVEIEMAKPAEVYTRLGAPAGASVSADIATRSSQSTQDTLAGYVDTEMASVLSTVTSGTYGNSALKALLDAIAGYIDTEIAAIKAKTDNLPAAPAAVGDLPAAAPSAATVAAAVATAILVTPANKLLTHTDGGVDALATVDTGLIADAVVTALESSTIPTAGSVAAAVRTNLATELGRIDVGVSTRLAGSAYTAPPAAAPTAAQVRAEMDASSTKLAHLDADVSTRLAASAYATPPSTAAIDAALAAAHGSGVWGGASGSGPIHRVYTLTDGTNPIAGALVRVTTDSGGNNTIASGTTDQYGKVAFDLGAGVVYLWRSKTGYTFANPDTETVV